VLHEVLTVKCGSRWEGTSWTESPWCFHRNQEMSPFPFTL